MNQVTEFKVGELYTNDQIRFALAVENLGGIRPALDAQGNLRHVVVLTAAEDSGKLHSENPYHDRIEGDVLTYTAQGRVGNQELAGRNKRLIEQYAVPVPFFGFVNVGRQTYRFLGLLELLRHSQEMQADRTKQLRKVWLFEFRIHPMPNVVPIEHARNLTEAILLESRKQNPVAELEREVVELGQEISAESAKQNPVEIEGIRGQLIQVAPLKFEHLVKSLMERSGFRDVSVTVASGDGGIDVNAYVDDANDWFAGTHVQSQVKRWRHAVGSVEINKFRGALSTTAKGVFITTSHFTRAAVVESRHQFKPCITLVDGQRLSSMVFQGKLDISKFM
jgi:HJR/Mrr/RecB family endonuclease